MHDKIFEITNQYYSPDFWAGKEDISDDEYGNIEGVDYYEETDEKVRTESIKRFFEKFPDHSFEIMKNDPGETAIVKFEGDIHELFDKWKEQISQAAAGLSEGITNETMLRLHNSLDHPFGIMSKFYQEDWNSCTVDADDFLECLRFLSDENLGKPFLLYIGQVFDYES